MPKSITLTFLGTGTSNGVPVLGCPCEVCHSADPHDRRLRTAAMIETEKTRILIDCGPDIRQQLMDKEFRRIDAVLVTHSHYDHVGGIDDLRPYCHFGDIQLYGNKEAVYGIRQMMPYCFTETLYPGVPRICLNAIEAGKAFSVGDIDIMPVEVMHHRLPVLAYRFGTISYVTDIKTIDKENLELLRGTETLVVSALRWEKEHHSHLLVRDAIELADAIGAHSTYLTHLTDRIGFHALASDRLPQGVELAYDGLKIICPKPVQN